MGYEVRLFVVDEHPSFNDNGVFWAENIAMIELCKCPLDVEWKEAGGFLYSEDGNTRITKDRYDKPMGVADIDEVITALDKVIDEYDYWRAVVAKNMLMTVREYTKFRNLKVYKFGH